MKFFLLFATLTISLSAHANSNPIKTDCTLNQYGEIGDAVRNYDYISGAELQNEVLVILLGDMGLDCKSVVDLHGNGIPGNKYEKFELYNAGYVYSIVIVKSKVEEPGLRTVSISKAGMFN